MQGNGASREPPGLPDDKLWQRSRMVDAAQDEAERYLDLAGFADRRLDVDDSERVAAWLEQDSVAASDVAAARELFGAAESANPLPAAITARARALVGGEVAPAAMVIPFPSRRRARPPLPIVARWAGLVAATVLASWLGFTL